MASYKVRGLLFYKDDPGEIGERETEIVQAHDADDAQYQAKKRWARMGASACRIEAVDLLSDFEIRRMLYDSLTKTDLLWIALSFASYTDGDELERGGPASMLRLVQEYDALVTAEAVDGGKIRPTLRAELSDRVKGLTEG